MTRPTVVIVSKRTATDGRPQPSGTEVASIVADAEGASKIIDAVMRGADVRISLEMEPDAAATFLDELRRIADLVTEDARRRADPGATRPRPGSTGAAEPARRRRHAGRRGPPGRHVPTHGRSTHGRGADRTRRPIHDRGDHRIRLVGRPPRPSRLLVHSRSLMSSSSSRSASPVSVNGEDCHFRFVSSARCSIRHSPAVVRSAGLRATGCAVRARSHSRPHRTSNRPKGWTSSRRSSPTRDRRRT